MLKSLGSISATPTPAASLTVQFSNLKLNNKSKRYRDYVFMAEVPALIITDQGISESDDCRELTEFCKNTINLLSNRTKRDLTYPLPLVPVKIGENDKISSDFFRKYSLENCVDNIRKETQYRITFHIVGHGTPTSIGVAEEKNQVSPEEHAARIQSLFEHYDLTDFKQKPISFVFHTCNSAYVEVSSEQTREEVFTQIKNDSFIGRFYQVMKAWGMQDMQVTGYRGYYASYTSGGAGSACIQDSFCNPKITKDASHGEYTLSEQGCSAPHVNREDLFFPVTVYPLSSQNQQVRQTKITPNEAFSSGKKISIALKASS